MKYAELKRYLRYKGCRKIYEDSNHERWYSPTSNKKFWVSRHNQEDVKPGTLNSILKQAGLK